RPPDHLRGPQLFRGPARPQHGHTMGSGVGAIYAGVAEDGRPARVRKLIDRRPTGGRTKAERVTSKDLNRLCAVLCVLCVLCFFVVKRSEPWRPWRVLASWR